MNLIERIARLVTRPWAVFLIVVAAFALWTGGRTVQSQDAPLYIAFADALRHGTLAQYQTTSAANWTVITFPCLVALARTIAPAHWAAVIVAINVLCAGITGVLLVRLVLLVLRSAALALIALLFYVSAYEIGSWTKYILADLIYSAVAMAVFFLALRPFVVDDDPPAKRRALLALLLVLALITRPTGVILIPFVVATEWWLLPAARGGRARGSVWILLLLGVIGAFVTRAYLTHDMNRWPTDFLRPKLVEYANREKRGEVVWDRPETSRRPPRSVADHLVIEGDRFVRFFQFHSPTYSKAHNLINVFYFVPLYLLAVIGVAGGLRSSDKRRQAIVQATLLLVIGSALLSALTVLDYDWRYRVPLMPPIILLAVCGAEWLARRVPVLARYASLPR